MKFDVVLHGSLDTVNNFDQRVAKLAELINIDINFIGPFLGAKETSVLTNLEFIEARQIMGKINDLGFKAEVRPTRKKSSSTKTEMSTDMKMEAVSKESLSLNQNKAKFKAPTDLPEEAPVPLKQRDPATSSVGSMKDVIDTDELALAADEDEYSNYNWSKDTEDDEVIKFDDDLVIKKGR